MAETSITGTIKKEPGNYILILYNEEQQEVAVGKLDTINLEPGYYLYVGSALGPGGVQSRVKRHSQVDKKCHWHIDYLRALTTLKSIWYLYSKQRYEHQFAAALEQMDKMSIPLIGFGASDCNCQAHLFYTTDKPKLNDHRQHLAEEIDLLELNYE